MELLLQLVKPNSPLLVDRNYNRGACLAQSPVLRELRAKVVVQSRRVLGSFLITLYPSLSLPLKLPRQTSVIMTSKDSAITVTIILDDPEIDSFRNMLLANNLLKFNHGQFYPGGITDRDRKMAQTLDFSQQALLKDFIRRRVEKLKESQELKKIKREMKELKKKKRADTTLVDGDEAPSKKVKLVQVQDNHADEERMTLEAVSLEDVDLQRQDVPHFEPVGKLMAEGLKACTRQAEKKNENVDQSKEM